MKKLIITAIAAASSLTACGGGSNSNFDTSNVVGRTFQATASSGEVELGGSRFYPVDSEDVSIRFTSTTSASVTTPNNVVNVFVDPSDGLYYSTSGNHSVLVGTELNGLAPTPDMLFLSVVESLSLSRVKIYSFVDGNRTSTGDLPVDADARYRGVSYGLDGGLNVGTGTVAVDINFASGGVTGTIENPLPNSVADFDLVPTTLTGGAFNTGLTSTQTNVLDSTFDGRVFGTTGDQLGGSLRLETDDGNVSAYYGAIKQ